MQDMLFHLWKNAKITIFTNYVKNLQDTEAATAGGKPSCVVAQE